MSRKRICEMKIYVIFHSYILNGKRVAVLTIPGSCQHAIQIKAPIGYECFGKKSAGTIVSTLLRHSQHDLTVLTHWTQTSEN